MGMWEAIFGIVVFALIVETFQKTIKLRTSATQAQQAARTADTAVLARLEKLERRMANLETIVLESEKKRQYERL